MTDKELVEALAKAMPEDAVKETVTRMLAQSVRNLNWSNDEINKLVKEVVVRRAQEMLKTDFKEQIETQARLLAASLVQNFTHVEFPRKDRY